MAAVLADRAPAGIGRDFVRHGAGISGVCLLYTSSVKAWMPGSLPAEIKKICRSGKEAVKKVLSDLRICREMNEDAARAGIRPNAQR